jgi:hypothetical protein
LPVVLYVLVSMYLAMILWPTMDSCGRLDQGAKLFVIFCILRS